ncbi:hypothetical protein BofuT4_uP069210.1 [Botrytis cinerea T4]|uniref:Uncharacterized protein n=1 Tax=Botryotinia fuckeliana (strain T4) TaxID=999810 RepID=G2XQH6_BOTF4|nr:hypothetical protein BofuT4_uP069210.1 [Botrytis cinerea T4]
MPHRPHRPLSATFYIMSTPKYSILSPPTPTTTPAPSPSPALIQHTIMNAIRMLELGYSCRVHTFIQCLIELNIISKSFVTIWTSTAFAPQPP